MDSGQTHLDLCSRGLLGLPQFEPWFLTADLSCNRLRSVPVFLPSDTNDRPSLVNLDFFTRAMNTFLRGFHFRRLYESI
jgi:hypothetical protein